MRVLGLIPARGGSKGIPGKNRRLLGGRPLLAWTAEIALAAEQFLAMRVTAIEEGAELARDAEESARQEFARGTTDVLTLLQATSRRIELDSQALTLRRLRLDNRINLHLALGGDYNP